MFMEPRLTLVLIDTSPQDIGVHFEVPLTASRDNETSSIQWRLSRYCIPPVVTRSCSTHSQDSDALYDHKGQGTSFTRQLPISELFVLPTSINDVPVKENGPSWKGKDVAPDGSSSASQSPLYLRSTVVRYHLLVEFPIDAHTMSQGGCMPVLGSMLQIFYKSELNMRPIF